MSASIVPSNSNNALPSSQNINTPLISQNQSLPPNVAPSAVNNTMNHSTHILYIGDLDDKVDGPTLSKFIKTNSGVNPIRSPVYRSNNTQQPLKHGYLHFYSREDAEKAMKICNYLYLEGKPVRMMHFQRDPSKRKSGKGNIIMKNLPKGIQPLQLFKIMQNIGPVDSLAVKKGSGDSLNAYIQFEHEEHAKTAVSALDESNISDKIVEVKPFVAQKEAFEKRDRHDKTFVNCYVKNLPKQLFSSEEKLENYFKKAGEITSCKLVRDSSDNPTGAAYICFNNHDDAVSACKEYNGKVLDDVEDAKPLVFTRFQRKNERIHNLREKFSNTSVTQLPKNNIYIKNLDSTVTDEVLSTEFGKYGKITSARVMTFPNGTSKRFGFVCYEDPAHAAKAIEEKHDALFFSKRLSVEYAQKFGDRQKYLKKQFPQYYPLSYIPHPVILGQSPNSPMQNNVQMHLAAAQAADMPNRMNKNLSYYQINNRNLNQYHPNAMNRQPFYHHQNHFQQHYQPNGANNNGNAVLNNNSHPSYSGFDDGSSNFNRSKYAPHHQQQAPQQQQSHQQSSSFNQNTQQQTKTTPLTMSDKNNFGQQFKAMFKTLNDQRFAPHQKKIIGVLLDLPYQKCEYLSKNPDNFKNVCEKILFELMHKNKE